jgi:hypothetical protein
MTVLTGLTHRLRGHRLREEFRDVDMSSRGPAKLIEAGRTNHLLICNCGVRWIRLPHPFTGKAKWR